MARRADSGPVLRLSDLGFAYADRAPVLRGIDLEVAPGTYVLLAGPSGAGKSTLLRCLNGLVPHFYRGQLRGSVTVAGRDVRDHPPAEMLDAVGLVPQNPSGALFSRTVEGELAFGLESLGVPTTEIGRRVRRAAERVGLADRLAQAPHTLSGGEQQRVLIGAFLALEPQVLLLDEPLAMLDPEMAARLQALLRALVDGGVTVIVAEHRLGPLLSDADRLVVLDEGTLVWDGRPDELSDEVATARGLFVDRFALDATADAEPTAANGDRPPQRVTDVAVEMDDVTMTLGDGRSLRDVSLTLGRGEIAALLGRNGSGKTTLLRHIAALRRPAAGRIDVLGRSIADRAASAVARNVGLVFQNPNDQLFRPRVRAELDVGPEALGIEDPAWADDLVRRFELGPLLDRSPFRLSEGQKRRVTFASVLTVRPSVVLLDEPSAGQDGHFRAALVTLLHQLAAEGHAVLFATHDLALAAAVADRWLVLADGRLAADGAVERVRAKADLLARAGLAPARADPPAGGRMKMTSEGAADVVAHDAASNATSNIATSDSATSDGTGNDTPPDWMPDPTPDPSARLRTDRGPGRARDRTPYRAPSETPADPGLSRTPGGQSDHARLDPRTRLLLLALAVAALAATPGPLALAVALGALLALGAWVAGTATVVRALRVIVPLGLVVVVVTGLTVDLTSALAAGLRLAAISAAALLVFATTPTEGLGNALVAGGLPYPAAFVIMTAVHFVPVLTRRAIAVRDAARARGIPVDTGLRALRHTPTLVLPLLYQSFRLADELAEALEARGFTRTGRTFRRRYRLGATDWVTLGAAAALTAAYLLR